MIKKFRQDDWRYILFCGYAVLKYSRQKQCVSHTKVVFFPKTPQNKAVAPAVEGEQRDDVLTTELKNVQSMLSAVDYDDVYLWCTNAGEMFLSMRYFDEICSINGSKKPVVLSDRPYANCLVKMFNPNVKFFSYSARCEQIVESNCGIEFDNHRFFYPFNYKYFKDFENRCKNNEDVYFYDNLVKHFHLKKCIVRKPIIPSQSLESALTLIGNLSKPYVLLMKDSTSNSPMSDWFWYEIEDKLSKMGFEIIDNSRIKLDFAGLRVIAERARAVIGVRSGACDIIADCVSKLFVIFAPFKYRCEFPPLSAKVINNVYSLNKLPIVKPEKIIEYNVSLQGESFILSDIERNLA